MDLDEIGRLKATCDACILAIMGGVGTGNCATEGGTCYGTWYNGWGREYGFGWRFVVLCWVLHFVWRFFTGFIGGGVRHLSWGLRVYGGCGDCCGGGIAGLRPFFGVFTEFLGVVAGGPGRGGDFTLILLALRVFWCMFGALGTNLCPTNLWVRLGHLGFRWLFSGHLLRTRGPL